LRLSRQARIEEALVQFEASESAVALVGMPGFRLLAAVEIDGELHQLVETTATVVGCGGVVEADLALPRWRLRGGQLERTVAGHRPPGVDDRAGPG
jgi:hypothetical protein